MSGRAGSDYFNKLVLLGKLRQACNHPLLLQSRANAFRHAEQPFPAPELAAAARLAPEVELPTTCSWFST